ncbi:hypothetical protein KZ810_03255 [Sphingomonas sp. RHCKR47]|uniref:hypothetical protein n=1 Tax=Sphingomonas citricola TaxID=2862498 RepID=UPI001CA5636F|nr:hypothetical protein [Sphingomonas citricola]MBW6522504.1 hypothetical protein [Sphingomonas citricola]
MNMQRRMDRLEAITLDGTKRVRVIFDGVATSPIMPNDQIINVRFVTPREERHG